MTFRSVFEGKIYQRHLLQFLRVDGFPSIIKYSINQETLLVIGSYQSYFYTMIYSKGSRMVYFSTRVYSNFQIQNKYVFYMMYHIFKSYLLSFENFLFRSLCYNQKEKSLKVFKRIKQIASRYTLIVKLHCVFQSLLIEPLSVFNQK